MQCKYCGRETKEGFPYCMNCGEWIGTRTESTLGSWGNPRFESSPRRLFLLRREDDRAVKTEARA